MWTHLLSAIGLVLVIEGVLPFLSPQRWQKTILKMAQSPPSVLRLISLGSMLIGLLILYALHGG